MNASSSNGLGHPSVARTHSLLGICLGDSAPLVDAVCRDSAQGGAAWWDETLTVVGAECSGPLPDRGRASSLLELEEWKDAAKRWTLLREPRDAAVRGAAVYLLVTALAVHDTGTSISSRPAHELVAAWLDLAEVTPEPWAQMFARAALALTSD